MSGIPAVQLGLQLFFLTQGDLCGVQFCHIFLHLALQRYFIFLQLETKHNTVIYMASRQDRHHDRTGITIGPTTWKHTYQWHLYTYTCKRL